MKIRSTKHCKFNINYHIVWCSKYRHQVLKGELEKYLKKLIYNIANHYSIDILNIEIMPDHIHIFVSAIPYISPTKIVKTLKSITAVWIFRKFPELKKHKFWGSGLWSKGYYVGTAGTVSAQTIQKYIENQKNI